MTSSILKWKKCRLDEKTVSAKPYIQRESMEKTDRLTTPNKRVKRETNKHC